MSVILRNSTSSFSRISLSQRNHGLLILNRMEMKKMTLIKPIDWFSPKPKIYSVANQKDPWPIDDHCNQNIDIEPEITQPNFPRTFAEMPHSNRIILKNLNANGYLLPSTVQQVISVMMEQKEHFIVESPRQSGKSTGTLISLVNKIFGEYPIELMTELRDNANSTMEYPLACVISGYMARITIPDLKNIANMISANTHLRVNAQYNFIFIGSAFDLQEKLTGKQISLKYCRHMIFDCVDFYTPINYQCCKDILSHRSISSEMKKIILGDFISMKSKSNIENYLFKQDETQPTTVTVGNSGALSKNVQYNFQFIHKSTDWIVSGSDALKQAFESDDTTLVILEKQNDKQEEFLTRIRGILSVDADDMNLKISLHKFRSQKSKFIFCTLNEALALNIPKVSRLICFHFPSSLESFSTIASFVKSDSTNPGLLQFIIRRSSLFQYNKDQLTVLETVRETMHEINQPNDGFFDQFMLWIIEDTSGNSDRTDARKDKIV